MDIKDLQEQNRRKIKVTFFYLLLVGMILLSSSVLVHRMISRQVDGRGYGLRGFLESLPFVSAQRVRGVKAAVLQSGFTADFLQSISEDPLAAERYIVLSELWMDYLERSNIEAEIISDNELPVRLEEFNLLILPMTICLSDSQISEVKRFLSRGRGVIASHASGLRDETGRQRKWSLASDLTGSAGFHFFRPEEEGEVVSFITAGGTPVSAGMSPGERIKLHTFDSPAGIEILEPRVRTAGFWEDADAAFSPATHTGKNAPAAYGKYLEGRFVWFGFTMRSVAEAEGSWRNFDIFLDNALKWAAKRTLVDKGAWPGMEKAAAIFAVKFAVKAENDFLEALSIVQYLKTLGIEPVGIIPASPAEINLAGIHRVSAAGGIIPFFSEEELFPAQPQAEKERAVRTVKSLLESEFGTSIDGIAVREGDREDITLVNAAFRSRLNYVWITGNRALSPSLLGANVRQPIFRRTGQPVFFYGESRALQKFYEYEMRSPRILLRDLKSELDRVALWGGMLPLIIHADKIRREDLSVFMPEFIRYMEENNIMRRSPSRTAEWWRSYENVRLSAGEDRPGRISIIISNTGGGRLETLPVYIYPPALPSEIRIQAEKIGAPIPGHRIDSAGGRIILDIENMSPNESRTYFITFL